MVENFSEEAKGVRSKRRLQGGKKKSRKEKNFKSARICRGGGEMGPILGEEKLLKPGEGS